MFGRSKQVPGKRIDSLIAAGTTVRGDIHFSGGLRVDGQVFGNVACDEGSASTLVVSEQARVDGSVRVSHVVLNGTVRGPVRATEYLELQAAARIVGDVSYKTLEMHAGAVVQGRLEHAEPGTAAVVEFKRAAAE